MRRGAVGARSTAFVSLAPNVFVRDSDVGDPAGTGRFLRNRLQPALRAGDAVRASSDEHPLPDSAVAYGDKR